MLSLVLNGTFDTDTASNNRSNYYPRKSSHLNNSSSSDEDSSDESGDEENDEENQYNATNNNNDNTSQLTDKKSEQEKKRSPDPDSTNTVVSFLGLFDRGKGIIVYYFSNSILNYLSTFPHKLQITLIIVEVFIIWIAVDTVIRKALSKLEILSRNTAWKKTIHSVIDFVSMLGIFLIVQLLPSNITSSWSESETTLYELLSAIYIVILTVFAAYQSIMVYSIPVAIE